MKKRTNRKRFATTCAVVTCSIPRINAHESRSLRQADLDTCSTDDLDPSCISVCHATHILFSFVDLVSVKISCAAAASVAFLSSRL